MLLPLLFLLRSRVSEGAHAHRASCGRVLFGHPGGSAVLSMQNDAARDGHDPADSGSASPAAELLRSVGGFSRWIPACVTHRRRSRDARGLGTADAMQDV